MKEILSQKFADITGHTLQNLMALEWGIYILCKGDTIMYVGQTTSLAMRIATHMHQKKGLFDRVLHTQPKSYKTALIYEKLLIRALKPPLNGKGHTCLNITKAEERKLQKFLKVPGFKSLRI